MRHSIYQITLSSMWLCISLFGVAFLTGCMQTSSHSTMNSGQPLNKTEAWLIKQRILKSNHDMIKKPISSVYFPSKIMVRLSSGLVKMHVSHTHEGYQAQSVVLHINTCDLLMLENTTKTDNAWVKLCYLNGILYIDSRTWHPNNVENALIIHASTLWNTGFSYMNMTTQGNAHFVNARVFVETNNS